MKRWIAHVDMDCFFVAVERLYDPSLIGRPVVVGGHSPRSVVAAASYEARAFGVFSAMPTVQALEKCRDLVIVRPNFERYSKASKTVFSILRELAPIVEPVSVDEAYLDFTGCDKLFPSREDAGLQIKKRILGETRLVASVGMSSNRMISKIASDLKKPDALVYVPEGEERTFLQDLSIAKIPGVGKKTVPTLMALGIRTCGDLAAKDRTWVQNSLTPHLGKWSLSLYERAQGIDPRPVGGDEAAKSIGAEETFTRDLRKQDEIERVILDLCEEVASSVRHEGRTGRTLTLKIRFPPFVTVTRSLTTATPLEYAQDMRVIALRLLDEFKGRPVRLLGISVKLSDLEEASEAQQLDLFSSPAEASQNAVEDRRSPETIKKLRSAELVKDELRQRFGAKVFLRHRDLKS